MMGGLLTDIHFRFDLMADQNPNQVLPSATPTTASTRDRVTGMDIRIDRAGIGPPVVFLNGLLGLNSHWFPCLPYLIHDHECLLLQPPLLEMKGKGCSVDGVVQLTLSILETLIDRPAVFVGNSLGGHVALRIALQRPDVVRGLVLVGSSGLFERTFEKDVQHSPSREWLERKIEELFCDPSLMPPGTVDMAYAELSRRSAARSLVRLARSAKRDHLGEDLPKVFAPVLLVWGRQDVVTPPAVAEEFHSKLPNSRLAWIENCGHAPQIERPREFGQVTARFLATLAGAVPFSVTEDGEGQQEVA